MIATIPQKHYNAHQEASRCFYGESEVFHPAKVSPIRARFPSPAGSIDEMEAAAALISMPTFASKDSRVNTSRNVYGPFQPSFTYERPELCRPVSPGDYIAPVNTLRHSHRQINSFSSIESLSDRSEESGYFGNETSPGVFYTGSVSLALPQDDDVLSPLHCFMRKFCVEAFSAQHDDITSPRYGKSHHGKIVVGQVGIRCIYCKHLPAQMRPERAACFPSSLHNIYHSIETWQRRHSAVCTELPGWTKRSMLELMQSSRSSAGGRRHYWEDAARELGLVDTPHGVRFARPPGAPEGNTQPLETSIRRFKTSIPLVATEDKKLVTGYLFLLMEQMQLCEFTEDDREGGRSKVKDFKVGFRGMECKHCLGKAGFGRYFPTSANALALANSDRNIYNHLRKCRRCPESIRNELQSLGPCESSKNKRGSRKQFFTNIWNRMHGSDMLFP